ncbi:peptidyl-prolyl cis-trans isomerase B (cyclophilin B) [Thermomonospora echinospora]|uniref:Peptidyl-prolyl cis-trans isomerase n=1 Tax=Thermomonospora echinospora TaxID=1992 RepID=A0A1H6DXK3_9ACTN|nr:peptidylprolyl isomerase [Thermomonospora echinospora]SEG89305.1 peptidyl-prolyl cis-trans isomerase B (cyclophilin B) [Thermomonospora echinospora]
MAGKDRKKQLARQRYERQQARRAAEARRARRVQIIGAVVGVAVIAGGGAGIVALVGGDEEPKASADASPSPPPQDGAPKQEISLQRVDVKTAPGGGTAKCEYPKSDNDQDPPKDLGKPPATAAHTGTVKATIKTNLGDVGVELDAAKAPCTTNSFAFLAGKKFFDKTKCHRLTTSDSLKVLQCGDPTGTGMGGPGYSFANENTKGAKYTKGVLAMANSGPDTNGSQFFIVYGDSQLEPDYTIFGKISSGMDVIEKVANAGVAAQ